MSSPQERQTTPPRPVIMTPPSSNSPQSAYGDLFRPGTPPASLSPFFLHSLQSIPKNPFRPSSPYRTDCQFPARFSQSQYPHHFGFWSNSLPSVQPIPGVMPVLRIPFPISNTDGLDDCLYAEYQRTAREILDEEGRLSRLARIPEIGLHLNDRLGAYGDAMRLFPQLIAMICECDDEMFERHVIPGRFHTLLLDLERTIRLHNQLYEVPRTEGHFDVNFGWRWCDPCARLQSIPPNLQNPRRFSPCPDCGKRLDITETP